MKPNIDDVCEAFNHFRNAIGLAVRSNVSRPDVAQAEITKAQDVLKSKLEQWGLAQYIDWEVRE